MDAHLIAEWFGTVNWPLIAQALAALGTLTLAGLTLRYTKATIRIANEAERSRESAEQPWIVVYPNFHDGLHVVVENAGRSVAADCHVNAAFDGAVYDHLDASIIDGSEVPPGVSVRRFAADLTMGAGRRAYPPIRVRCRWRWAERGRSYDQEYVVDPGLALPF